ncbi:Tn3 family transposase [Streptomyces sp. NPDC056160]|uniref:Tn3 family transposase n=1 Tax=Streptomyces sp. NPDC056160 TaxID=3345731 RepID=UPI0035D84B8E
MGSKQRTYTPEFREGAVRAAVTRLVNGTFAARDAAWWGQGTACASDSKKFGSWSSNFMTEYHARYGTGVGAGSPEFSLTA